MLNTHQSIKPTDQHYFVGIDISKRNHVVSLINQDNQVLIRNRSFTVSRTGFEQLLYLLLEYQAHGSVSLACEATGHYWLSIFQFLTEAGFTLHVFNPLQVACRRNQGIRGSKTDSDDSVLIAQVLKFGDQAPKEIPQEQLFELKELSRFRLDVKQQATAVKLKLIHVLDQVFPEFATLFADVTGTTAKAVLSEYSLPEQIEEVSVKQLTQVLKTASKNYYDQTAAIKLKDTARHSIGLKFGLDSFVLQIKLLLQQVDYLEKQTKELDVRIKQLVNQQQTRILTIPGISHTLAGVILGERLGFTKQEPKAFLAWAGMDPKKNDSGEHRGKTKMSKRGSRILRHALWMAACSARICSPTFKAIYDTQRSRGKSYQVAISHVAKKMAYVVNHVLVTKEDFKEQITNFNP